MTNVEEKKFHLLLVDDAKSEIDSCEIAVYDWNEENRNKKIELYCVGSVDEANKALDKYRIDGAIIDIRLNDDEKGGNAVIESIINKYKIPIIIVTGTPGYTGRNHKCIQCASKPYKYIDAIKYLMEMSEKPLFKVLSSGGMVEWHLVNIFWKSLCPKFQLWDELSCLGKDSERIILRNVLAYMQELLDDENEEYCKEELYLEPTLINKIKTGSVIQSRGEGTFYIVLSPPCDLVKDGKRTPDRVMLCEIEDIKTCHKDVLGKNNGAKGKINDQLQKQYINFLPPCQFFKGGYVNFRKVHSIDFLQLEDYTHEAKLHDAFVKEVLRKFSTYYSRQGQPELDEKNMDVILTICESDNEEN